MSQPPLPAPPSKRPDPRAQLLEAVRQRQADRSLQLAQQWVHRRGVLDLQRFCNTELSGAEGLEAVAWLQALLGLEQPAAADMASPQSPDPGPQPRIAAEDSPQQRAEPATRSVDPLPGDGVEPLQVPAASRTPPPVQTQQALEESELQVRAVAAVDEAFAALAQTFQEDAGDRAAAASTPEPASFPVGPAALETRAPAPDAPPQPLPVQGSLWPSLQASAASLSAALRPAIGHGSQRQQASLAGAPQATGAAEHLPNPTRLLQDESQPAAAVPALQEDPTSLELPADLAGDGLNAAAFDDPAPVPGGIGAEARPSAASAAIADSDHGAGEGLLQRLRGRLQPRRLPRLTRLRAVMRDCFDETVAQLRTPEADDRDEQVFDLSTPLEAAPSRAVQAQSNPPWSIEPFQPPTTTPDAAAAETPEPTTWPPTPAAAETAPASPTAATPPATDAAAATAGLRAAASLQAPRLAAGQPAPVSDRPAPAPAALSDLQAWLPDRRDLPRAS